MSFDWHALQLAAVEANRLCDDGTHLGLSDDHPAVLQKNRSVDVYLSPRKAERCWSLLRLWLVWEQAVCNALRKQLGRPQTPDKSKPDLTETGLQAMEVAGDRLRVSATVLQCKH